MHLKIAATCSLVLVAGSLFSAAQDPPPRPTVLVYHDDDGIKPPELASTDFSSVVLNNCQYDGVGIVRISLVVNPQGRSEKIAPLYPFNDDIDKAAVSIAEVDRFSPGAKDGVPVAVAQELEIKLTLCRVKILNKDGTMSDRLRLKSVPVQRLYPASQTLPAPPAFIQVPLIQAPVPLETPEPEYPPELRARHIGGACLTQLVVDAKGQPQSMRISRGINEELNEKALEAIAKYRFKPSTKDKQPIPVRMMIVTNFVP